MRIDHTGTLDPPRTTIPTDGGGRTWTPDALDHALADVTHRRRGGGSRGPHRLAALLGAIGDPQRRTNAVRIVGTDGKTSVTRLLGGLLSASGRRVGTTTSPHLERVDERIRLDGAPLPPTLLGPAVDAVRAALPRVDAAGEPVSFFEVITATAVQSFADARVDHVLVEAGIGGIGDATAAIPADVVVLTRVGLDHPELGSTLAAVTREKASVLPVGGTLVSGPQAPQVDAALAEVVAAREARWLRAGVDHGVLDRQPGDDGQHVTVRGPAERVVDVWLPLWGAHQADNAATALATLAVVLGGWPSPDELRSALAGVSVPGRTERLVDAAGPELVLDGAHDVPAVDALVAALAERPVSGPTVVLLGTTGDRDPGPLAAQLTAGGAQVRSVDATCAGTELAHELAAARSRVGPDGRVVVTGSLYLVGAARSQVTSRQLAVR